MTDRTAGGAYPKAWLIAAAVILAISLLLLAYQLHKQSSAAAAGGTEPIETVQIAKVRVVPLDIPIRAVGTIVAAEAVEIRSEVAGVVRQVGARSGAVVPKGTMLIALNIGEEKARLTAQLARADLARRNLERARQLTARGFVSQSQVDGLMAEARAQNSEAAALRALISKKHIRAPFTGRVGIHDVHPGQYLEEGRRITSLQGVGPTRYVDFTLPSSMAAAVKPGDLVKVSNPGVRNGRIVARDALANDVRQIRYRSVVSDGAAILLPGGFVEVSLSPGAPRRALLVPRTALIERAHATYVFRIVPDRAGPLRARQQVVTVGPIVGDEISIESGLRAGERIVADGAFKLRHGMQVLASSGR